jgi:hypothetical protein
MAAEIVNLRKARKARDRAGREAEAAANRAKFGRSKDEREAESLEAARKARVLDAHRRDEPGGDA